MYKRQDKCFCNSNHLIPGSGCFQTEIIQPVLTDKVQVNTIGIYRYVWQCTEGSVYGCIVDRTSFGSLDDFFYLFGCVLVELRPEVCKKICSCCLYQVVTGWCNDCIRKGSRCDCQRYFLLEVRCITCSPVADNFDVVVIQKVSGVLVVIYGIAVRKCGICLLYTSPSPRDCS